MKTVTILIPCYNEEASLPRLEAALKELMQKQDGYLWEILLVNDGSKDHTLEKIKEMNLGGWQASTMPMATA